MNKFSLLLCLAGALAGGQIAARASAQLKPTTGATQALRAKNLDVAATVNGAFATSTVTTVYDNPNEERIEADFIYSAPPGAIVTGFAYWYQGEKVVARVVEKERAAQIYQYITSRMRDPALVEMIGKNTFRARIFPVEPRTDLKIEVQLAHRLDATPGGWRWSFPLRDETADAPLDNLTMRVRVPQNRVARSNVAGNLKGGSLQLARQNFTAQDDVRVEVRNATARRAELYAARDGGSDGFFALAVAGQKLPRIVGVKTYDLVTEKTTGATYLYGRYRGAGAASIGGGASVKFDNKVAKGNVASLLWGGGADVRIVQDRGQSRQGRRFVQAVWDALEVDELAGDPQRRTPKLQEANFGFRPRFGGASLRSSRRARRRQSGAKAEGARGRRDPTIGRCGRRLLVERGARAFVGIISIKSCKTCDARERERATKGLGQAVGAMENVGEKPAARRCPRWRQGVEMPIYLLEDELRIASRLLAGEIQNGRGQGKRAKALKRATERISEHSNGAQYRWGADTFLSEQVENRKADLALEIAVNRLSERPNATLQAQKTKQLQRLAKRFGSDADDSIEGAVRTAARPRAESLANKVARQEARGETVTERARLDKLAKLAQSSSTDLLKTARAERLRSTFNATTDDLVSEILAGRETTEKAQQLSERVTDLENKSSDWWQKDAVARAYNGRSHALAYDIEAERAKTNSDAGRIARLQAQLNETAKRSGSADTQQFLDWEKRRVAEKQGPVNVEDYRYRVAGLDPNNVRGGYGYGDPLLAINAPADARLVVAIMPNGEVKPLEWRAQNKRWEANFDIPMDTRADSYLVTVVITLRDGTRKTLKLRYRVDAQAPTGNALIRGTDDAQLHLEISASDDTSRVIALLPWGDRLTLRRGKDGAFATDVALPATWDKPSVPVRFVLVDSAHNRTEIIVDWNK